MDFLLNLWLVDVPHQYVKSVIVPIFVTIILSLAPAIYLKSIEISEWGFLILNTIWSLISVSVCLFLIIMTKDERRSIISTISNKLKR